MTAQKHTYFEVLPGDHVNVDNEATGVAHDPHAQKEIISRRAAIDRLDAEILALVQRRREVSVEIQTVRIAAGGTRISTQRERTVVGRYAAAIGSHGAELATLILRISRHGPGQA